MITGQMVLIVVSYYPALQLEQSFVTKIHQIVTICVARAYGYLEDERRYHGNASVRLKLMTCLTLSLMTTAPRGSLTVSREVKSSAKKVVNCINSLNL